MAYNKVAMSGKGGSFSVANSVTPTYTDYAMTDWTLTKEVESLEVTNFMSKPVNTSVVASGTVVQAVQQVVAGIRKFSIEAKGYPTTSAGVSGLFSTRAEQDASIIPGVNAGSPNVTNPMLVGEKVKFLLGVEVGSALVIGPFDARITDFKYTNSISGTMECTISAVGVVQDNGNTPVGFTG